MFTENGSFYRTTVVSASLPLRPRFGWGRLVVPTIGDRIKEVREKRQRTQKWLAKETGISKGFLSEVENNKGTGNIGADYVIRISNALGVSLDYLLRGEVAQQDIARQPVTI